MAEKKKSQGIILAISCNNKTHASETSRLLGEQDFGELYRQGGWLYI